MKKIKTRMSTRLLRTLIFFFTFFSGILFTSIHVWAATLAITPGSGSYSVGNIITARVIVGSAGQSINAIGGQVSFSSNTLTLVGISKNNSVITLWAQDPTYSNGAGTASFQGVTLNGYTGNGGTVVTLTFKAKAVGTGTIQISSSNSSVLLNDGQGTDVLTGVSDATFTINKAVIVAPTPAPVIAPVVTPVPTVAVVPTPSVAPLFTDYQSPLSPGSFIVVKGTATPDTMLNISVTHTAANGDTTVTQDTIPVVTSGLFVYVSDDKVSEGSIYTIIATGADGQHTTPLTLPVKDSLTYIIVTLLLAIFSIKVSVTFAFLLLLLTLYLLYRNRVLRKRLREKTNAL